MADQQPSQEEVGEEKVEQTPVSDESSGKLSDSEPPKKEKESSQSEISNEGEEIDEMTTLHERTIAVLSYFGFLAIVPFYLKKDSKFCRFHGKQGMTLSIVFFLAQFIAVLDLFMDLMLILQAVIALWMGFAALSGRWKKTPIIYDWSCQLEESLSLKTVEEMAEDATLKPNQTSVEKPEDKK